MKIDAIKSAKGADNWREVSVERYEKLSEKIEVMNKAFHKNISGLLTDEELDKVLKY